MWGPKHFTMIADIIAREGSQNLIKLHLESSVGANLFLQMSNNEKLAFVKDLYERLGHSHEVSQTLSSKFYAPYFLLILTERDTFMRTTDFTYYNRALENTSSFELEILANSSNEYEEQFVKFMRYVDLLDQTDHKKPEGKKFINSIFNIDKFKAYQN